jgi:hypothetical protein
MGYPVLRAVDCPARLSTGGTDRVSLLQCIIEPVILVNPGRSGNDFPLVPPVSNFSELFNLFAKKQIVSTPVISCNPKMIVASDTGGPCWQWAGYQSQPWKSDGEQPATE